MAQDEVVLFGPAYSVYVRSARLALEEKGVRYRLEEFELDAMPDEHRARHPFGKVPAFRHGDFALYETGAVIRYVDEAFVGPSLQPAAPRRRARMNQAISIIDNYGYWPLVREIFVERVMAKLRGRAPDEAVVAAALPKARLCFGALEALIGEERFLAGASISLADLHAAPMIAYFARTPEGEALLGEHEHLDAWWRSVRGRESMAATRSRLEER